MRGNKFKNNSNEDRPILVAARSKAWVCSSSLAGIAVSSPAVAMDVLFVVCCQVEVSATGWSLVQSSPTDCGVSECDREASIVRRLRPTKAFEQLEKLNVMRTMVIVTVTTMILVLTMTVIVIRFIITLAMLLIIMVKILIIQFTLINVL